MPEPARVTRIGKRSEPATRPGSITRGQLTCRRRAVSPQACVVATRRPNAPGSPAGRLHLGFGGLLIALLSACSDTVPVESLPRPVRVTTVHYGAFSPTARYSGEVRARYETMLAFQVSGKIAKRAVDVGARVQRGQLLATLDPADYDLNQAGARAQLAAAQAELHRARSDLLHLENLMDKNLSSEAAVERRRDAVQAAEARVAEARSALQLNARKSGYTALRAEQSGVITAVEAEAGQVVSSGQTVFRLARPGEKEVVINVPENRLDDLRAASDVTISLWAEPGVVYQGRVREISPGVDAVIRTYTVKVTLIKPDDRVRMGLTATVRVQRQVPQPIAEIPLTALHRDGDRAAVWVIDSATQKVRLSPVMLGRYGDRNATILGGVTEGEQIVTAGVHKLLPGETVRILGEHSAP